MHVLTVLFFAVGALALPGFTWIPWGCSTSGATSDIPPSSIRDQFPQFNESQWEAYHCLTFTDLLTIVPPCADYCETYAIGAVTPGDFARDGCHEDDFPCHCANSQKLSDAC